MLPLKRVKMYQESSTMSAEFGSHSINLSSANFSSKVLGGLKTLQQDGLLCDYTLAAEGLEVKVHRVVMAACSDYFRVMMTGSMKESKEDKVHLQGVSSTGLMSVIDFAYSGNMALNNDNVECILAAAVHLQMPEAVDLCCRFLHTALSADNCVDILNLTNLYSLPEDSIRTYILDNFEAIARYDQFFQLTLEQMEDLLQSNGLKVSSEYTLFQLVLKWIDYDRASREQLAQSLMQHVRLPLLSGEELVENVSSVDIMITNKACFNLLNEAKDYHIVTSKRPMLQTSRTRVRSETKSLVTCFSESADAYNLKDKRLYLLKDVIVPVYDPRVCVVDNFMYVCGGKYDMADTSEIATMRCFRYDPRFDTWFETDAMEEARKDFVLLAFDKQLFAIGGRDETTLSSTIECYSITNNEWDFTNTFLGSDIPRYNAAGAVCGNYIYCSGGRLAQGYSQKLIRYDPVGDVYIEKAQMIQPRANHIMECVANALYIIGGNSTYAGGAPVNITSVERYNVDTDQWTICRSVINIRGAGSCVSDGQIYIVGGLSDDRNSSDAIELYSPSYDRTEIVGRFTGRIYGCKSCCILTLPLCV